ncbi:alpha-mannosidase [Exidia glandulosa HHB12029]|uniref:alpha-1,2-Mannosidase n=1 Tax=Exidia glandulosa HHB12029 TaxID=1314781 RepID=A0A165QRG7_EXIGL|nr:alpha-mannosidase [Exidia glandulosa HHB12029]
MRWPSAGRILSLWSAASLLGGHHDPVAAQPAPWDDRRKADLRCVRACSLQQLLNATRSDKTRALWYHGFDSYMQYGKYAPCADTLEQLRPLTCSGRGPDWENQNNIAVNDVAGNYSLTLVDVLDTFVVLQDAAGFARAVRQVIEHVSYDVGTRPQVFEVTIRALGGLISGHIFASEPRYGFALDWYNGELLGLALDLGERLLPAFKTGTGMPYARVHLQRGVLAGETSETCTAGAGSLLLEFATLSRLSGDDRFEKAAFKAFFALWNRKSEIGLVGNTVNIWTGAWTAPAYAAIGAGQDSFYEYALKWYILSGEPQFLDVWNDAYAAVMQYVRGPEGFWYRRVNMDSGDVSYWTLDSLSAFWPGLQVLGGDIENAVKSHLIYWNLWKRFAGLPEMYDINHGVATTLSYPLRPEFVESTWYLYTATRDPFYLDVGERILSDLTRRAKVDCGLTGIEDLITNKQSDRMESFVLSETLKYLYLLFDEHNPINKDDSNFVFTTEGHVLHLNSTHIKPPSAARRKLRPVDSSQCPPYEQRHLNLQKANNSAFMGGIRSLPEFEFGRHLLGILPSSKLAEDDEPYWMHDGWCEKPKHQQYTFDFVLSVGGEKVSEDPLPGPAKLVQVPEGFMLYDVSGIRTHLRTRLDGKGVEITRLGPYTIRSGQKVFVKDSRLYTPSASETADAHEHERPLEVRLSFSLTNIDAVRDLWPGIDSLPQDSSFMAWTALFGGDPSVSGEHGLRFGQDSAPLQLVQDIDNPFGCEPYNDHAIPPNSVVLVHRGSCTFAEKLDEASLAGAAGVIVVSGDDAVLNPSSDPSDTSVVDGTLDDVALVAVSKTDGSAILRMLEVADQFEPVHLMVRVDEERTMLPAEEASPSQGIVLYINGHPVTNAILSA